MRTSRFSIDQFLIIVLVLVLTLAGAGAVVMTRLADNTRKNTENITRVRQIVEEVTSPQAQAEQQRIVGKLLGQNCRILYHVELQTGDIDAYVKQCLASP